jgi:aspartate carbamoyltransferase
MNMAPLGKRSTFKGQDILSISQFSREGLETVFRTASAMAEIVDKRGTSDLLRDKLLCTIFYEPSTRTNMSFQAAMQRLGGRVITIADVSTSSVAKGETLADTLRTLESYCDVIVLRLPEAPALYEGAEAIQIPLINAGNGADEHPTQALLDMYTIQRELGRIKNLKIGMLGDLKHGRTVHSLSLCAALFDNELHFISPEDLRMPSPLLEKLNGIPVRYHEHTDIHEILAELDVLYVTRIQRERFPASDLSVYERLKGSYTVDSAMLLAAKPSLRILHPLPRVDEIAREVDSDPRAAYFRQVRYGMFVRMALFALLFGRARS